MVGFELGTLNSTIWLIEEPLFYLQNVGDKQLALSFILYKKDQWEINSFLSTVKWV